MSTYLGEFELLVLLALLRLGDGAGTPAIREAVETGARRRVWLGAVYTTLERLEGKGLVKSMIVESPAGGRSRKTYRLEAAGEAALAQAYETWTRMIRGLKPKLESLG